MRRRLMLMMMMMMAFNACIVLALLFTSSSSSFTYMCACVGEQKEVELMWQVLVEVLVSLVASLAIIYVFFLNAAVEEEVRVEDGGLSTPHNNNKHHHQRGDDDHRAPPHNWRERWALYLVRGADEEDSILVKSRVFVVAHILGIDPSSLQQQQQQQQQQHVRADDVDEEEVRMTTARQRRRGTATSGRGQSPWMRQEPATWVNALVRGGALIFLGGGSVAHETWIDRITFGMESAIHKMNAAWQRHQHTRHATTTTTTTVASMKELPSSSSPPLLWLCEAVELTPGTIGGGLANLNAASPSAAPVVGVEKDVAHRRTLSVDDVASTVGVLLPQVAGEVLSVELPSYIPGTTPLPPSLMQAASTTTTATTTTTDEAGIAHADGDDDAHASSSPSPPRPTASNNISPSPRTLRCFRIPLGYDDHQFHLQLGACVPLFALLPTRFACIPAEVLSLECEIIIRRLHLHAHIHAACLGGRVECCFATRPSFSAHFDVSTPSSGKTMMAMASRGASMPSTSASPAPLLRPASSSVAAGSVVGSGHDVGASSSSLQQQHPRRRGGGVEVRRVTASRHRPARSVFSHNEKMEEIVRNAVEMAMASITHPNVLVAGIHDGALRWTRELATLPLCVSA